MNPQSAGPTRLDILGFFCRHLVGLGWYEALVNEHGDFVQPPTFYGASGFLLQLHGDLPDLLCLVTAGHVLTDYKKRLSNPRIRAAQHSLFDIWGPSSTCKARIPFDFTAVPALVEYDTDAGFDYAVVALPGLVRRLLAQTTTPFTKQNWCHQQSLQFGFYHILGIPLECAQQVFSREEGREAVTTFPSPALIRLQPCPLPNDLAPAADAQFVAQICPSQPIGNIVGMSGGPILGFTENVHGQLAYWPVAVQSRWLPKRRIVIGTSVPAFASKVERWIDELLSRESMLDAPDTDGST